MRRLPPRRAPLWAVPNRHRQWPSRDQPADADRSPPWQKRRPLHMQEIDPLPERTRSHLTRTFPLAAVLSVYHNKMLVSFQEFRELLNYSTGVQVALWEIPRARTQVAEHLSRQFVWLKHAELPPGFRVDSGNANRYVKQVAKTIGGATELEVKAMRKGAYKPITGTQALKNLRRA